MEFCVTTGSIRKNVSGHYDWALSYMDDKRKFHETLVVIETKAPGNIYATAIFDISRLGPSRPILS